MGDGAIVEELHGNGVTGSDIGDLGISSVAERAQVAAEIAVTGSQVVEGVGELGGHIALGSGSLADVLPVIGGDAVQNKLAKDVMG